MNNNIAISFTMRYSEYRNAGNDEQRSFLLVGNEFLKRIKVIHSVASFGVYYLRKFSFMDGSSCTFKNGYWKFNHNNKN